MGHEAEAWGQDNQFCRSILLPRLYPALYRVVLETPGDLRLKEPPVWGHRCSQNHRVRVRGWGKERGPEEQKSGRIGGGDIDLGQEEGEEFYLERGRKGHFRQRVEQRNYSVDCLEKNQGSWVQVLPLASCVTLGR